MSTLVDQVKALISVRESEALGIGVYVYAGDDLVIAGCISIIAGHYQAHFNEVLDENNSVTYFDSFHASDDEHPELDLPLVIDELARRVAANAWLMFRLGLGPMPELNCEVDFS